METVRQRTRTAVKDGDISSLRALVDEHGADATLNQPFHYDDEYPRMIYKAVSRGHTEMVSSCRAGRRVANRVDEPWITPAAV